MRGLVLFLLILFSQTIQGQIIISKNGKYGLLNSNTGDVLLERNYDSIYQLTLKPRTLSPEFENPKLPIFVCIQNHQIRLYNSYAEQFYADTFDEIKLYRQYDEQCCGKVNFRYIPYWVDCFMLRRGENWGYIAYPHHYNLSVIPEPSDTFVMIKPQFHELKYIEETPNSELNLGGRKRRLLAARRDSLWGAIDFETSALLVPFIYPVPIHTIRHGFFPKHPANDSVAPAFDFYFIARVDWESKPQFIINPLYPEIANSLDFEPVVRIEKAFSETYLFLEPQRETEGSFELFEYNTGRKLMSIKRDLRYKHFTAKIPYNNILVITESSIYKNMYRITWYNLSTGIELLFSEGKLFADIDFSIENKQTVMLERKPVGKIIGEGKDLKIEWTTSKVYQR